MITGKIVPPRLDAIRDKGEEYLWIGRPLLIPFLLQDHRLLLGSLAAPAVLALYCLAAMMAQRTVELPWQWLLSIFLSPATAIVQLAYLALTYRNTFYAVSDRRVIISHGLYAPEFHAFDYDRLRQVEVTYGPVESWYGAGTIRGFAGADPEEEQEHQLFGQHRRRPVFPRTDNRFIAVSEPYRIFHLIKRTATEVKTDWQYPNALRPRENRGRPITRA